MGKDPAPPSGFPDRAPRRPRKSASRYRPAKTRGGSRIEKELLKTASPVIRRMLR